MAYKYRATGNDIGGKVEMIYEEGPWKDIAWTFYGMKFADKENDDGSIQMHYEYDITSELKPEDIPAFEASTGDVIIDILEQQMAKGEVIYRGTGDGEIQQTEDGEVGKSDI